MLIYDNTKIIRENKNTREREREREKERESEREGEKGFRENGPRINKINSMNENPMKL